MEKMDGILFLTIGSTIILAAILLWRIVRKYPPKSIDFQQLKHVDIKCIYSVIDVDSEYLLVKRLGKWFPYLIRAETVPTGSWSGAPKNGKLKPGDLFEVTFSDLTSPKNGKGLALVPVIFKSRR